MYGLLDRNNSVAKIYQKPIGRDQTSKIIEMSRCGTEELIKLSAWPTSVVIDRGKPIGFVMKKFSGFRPAFELYGPKLRLQKFPKADWRFLIRTASNTARAVAAVHDAGHVLGDINHGNMIVGQDATVRLIDCDSFQISIGSQTWFCDVGVPTHQPPELQGVSFSALKRSPNHDAFGLAVLIFQMLCLARHPYSGVWLGHGEQPAIEDSIRAFRYAYSNNQLRTQMSPPPRSLPVAALGTEISSLFEQAFSPAGARPSGRPSARDWIQSLTRLESSLRQCASVPSHHFPKTLSRCPWCIIESESGTTLFPATFVKSEIGPDGFMILWQQLEGVFIPRSTPPPRPPSPSKPSSSARQAGLIRKTIAGFFIVIVTVLWLVVSRQNSDPLDAQSFWVAFVPLSLLFIVLLQVIGRKFFRAKREIDKKWQSILLKCASNDDARRAIEIKEKSKTIKSEYDAIVASKKSSLAGLQANRRERQLYRYLNSFRIEGAGISGVGSGKAATLQSFGIETAADIAEQRIYQIPGFGPKTVEKLVAWREQRAQGFRFNPNEPVAQSDIAAVEHAFAQKRRDLEQRLKGLLSDLLSATSAAARYEEILELEKASLLPQYAAAMADKRAAALLF